MAQDLPKSMLDVEREREALEAAAMPGIEREGERPSTGATSAGCFSTGLRATGGADDIYRATGSDPTTLDGKPRGPKR